MFKNCGRQLAFLFAITAVAVAAMPLISEAQVYIGPSVTEVRVRPGETGEVAFEIANHSEQDMKINVEAANWLVEYLKREGSRDDVYEWIDFGEYSEFTAPAQKLSTLKCTIAPPKDFQGERVAQVFFEYEAIEPTAEQAHTAEMLKQRIGLLLCVSAKGTEKLDAEMEFKDVGMKPLEGGKLDVWASYLVKNKGNIHFKPRGTARIKRGKEIIAEMDAGVLKGLYTEQEESYATTFSGLTLSPGKYQMELDLKMLSYDLEKRIKKSKKFEIGKSK